MKRLTKIMATVTLSALIIVISSGNLVSALLSNYYFDSRDEISSWQGQTGYGTERMPWLVAGEALSTHIINTEVKIYFPGPSGDVDIIGAGFCSASNIDDYYGSGTLQPGQAVTRFRVQNSKGTRDTVYGRAMLGTPNAGCNDNNSTYNMRVNLTPHLELDSITGRYSVTLYVDGNKDNSRCPIDKTPAACSGIENYFRLYTPTSGGIITHSGGETGNNTSMNVKGLPYVYSHYTVQFGSDCNVREKVTKHVRFYDLDNTEGSDIQPQPLSVKIYEEGNPAPLKSATPATASSTFWDMEFEAQPQKKYKMIIEKAYSNNLIQFSLPFDGIYALETIDCKPYLSNSTSLGPDPVYAGQTVTAKLSFSNTGLNPTGDMDYNWWIRAYTGANGTGSEVPGSLVQRPWTVSVDAKSTRAISDFPYTVPSSGVGSVCTQTQITSASPDIQLVNFLGPPGIFTQKMCVNVAKYPALQVRGGDVRIGGSFKQGVDPCYIPMGLTSDRKPYGVITHNYGGTRGSKGQYATFTPGEIVQFGSHDLAYASPSDIPSQRLFFGSRVFTGINGLFLGDELNKKPGYPKIESYCLPSTSSLYAGDTATTSVTLASGANSKPINITENYAFPANNGGTLTLNTPANVTLNKNQKVFIKVTQPPGTPTAGQSKNKIVISSNLAFNSTAGYYASISELPQFVLIADGDIDVQFSAGVQSFSGIISTKGDIETCGEANKGTSSLRSGPGQTCSNQIDIKGALIASSRIYPFRTYGFNSLSESEYAEEFRLTPEILLGDLARARTKPTLKIDHQTELPPRL